MHRERIYGVGLAGLAGWRAGAGLLAQWQPKGKCKGSANVQKFHIIFLLVAVCFL